MSGFEIAGIALAAFPLLAKGVESMVNGLEKYKRWRRCKLKLIEYLHILRSART